MESERAEEVSDLDELDVQASLKDLLPQGIDDLDDSERRRAFTLAALQFETFVVEILRSTVESTDFAEQRPTRFSGHGRFEFVSDASIRDLPPPIAFEVKYSRSHEQMAAAAREFRAAAEGSETRMRTLVFVTNLEPTARDKAALRPLRPRFLPRR